MGLGGLMLSHRYCPDGMTLEEWQIALRKQVAKEKTFLVEHLDESRIWGDYSVLSGRNRYRVSFSGVCSESNFCSCLDFRTNGLGTCKHIEAVSLKLSKEIEGYPWAGLSFSPSYSFIYVSYKEQRSIKLFVGNNRREEITLWGKKYFDEDSTLLPHFYKDIANVYREGKQISPDFVCRDDVYDTIENYLSESNWNSLVIQNNPSGRCITIPELGPLSANIQQSIYDILLRGYGFIVSPMSQTFRFRILSLLSYVLNYDKGRGLIVCNSTDNISDWRTLIQRYIVSEYTIEIVSTEQIATLQKRISGLYSFVYVEEAHFLSEWKDPTSLAIKKLAIKHLYIHLSSIASLTPMQFSSIAQHISPYIVGPLYLFIKNSRSVFPLNNDGSNLPQTVKPFVFFFNESELSDRNSLSSLTDSTDEVEVRETLSKLRNILAEPKKVQILQRLLTKIIDE